MRGSQKHQNVIIIERAHALAMAGVLASSRALALHLRGNASTALFQKRSEMPYTLREKQRTNFKVSDAKRFRTLTAKQVSVIHSSRRRPLRTSTG